MLTSKDVMRLTGISRATLNNYIALGVAPRPSVGPAASPTERARRIGWFEDSVVERIREVQRLKAEGVPMAEIARRYGGEGRRRTATAPSPTAVEPAGQTAPRLSLDALPHPVYLMNANCDLEWCNEAAQALFGPAAPAQGAARRNLFALLLDAPALRASSEFRSLLAFHLAAAKPRLPRAALDESAPAAGAASVELLRGLYDEAEPIVRRQVARLDDAAAVAGERWTVFVAFFREGALFAWTPAEGEPAALLELLARREQVIRDLLRRRPPLVTPLAVLVADLQDAAQLKAELPPEDFFALVNDVWSAAEPSLRRYHGVRGKHRGEGVVSYFLPQPDGHYGLNAALCADELRAAMPELERRWRLRRRHDIRLSLNIGLDEGREWFGSYQSAAHLEFAALGSAAERAARLAASARDGAVLASRRLLANLPPAERRRLNWGVKKRDAEGRTWRKAEAFGAADGADGLMAAEIFEVATARGARN
jgi:class 3 adenylate cyclase